jgi:hypothetical protein
MPPTPLKLDIANTVTAAATATTLGSISAAPSLFPPTAPPTSFSETSDGSERSARFAPESIIVTRTPSIGTATESSNGEHGPCQSPSGPYVAGCTHSKEEVKILNRRDNEPIQLTGTQVGVILGILGFVFLALYFGDQVWIICRECAKPRKAERDQPSTHDHSVPDRRRQAAEGHPPQLTRPGDIELSRCLAPDRDREVTRAPVVPESAYSRSVSQG